MADDDLLPASIWSLPRGEVDPPPNAPRHVLPCHLLPWEDFERLCLDLALNEGLPHGGRRFGTPGQAQDGIDVFVRGDGGRYVLYQCKRVETVTGTLIREAVEAIRAGRWWPRAQRIVICVSIPALDTKAQLAVEEIDRLHVGADGSTRIDYREGRYFEMLVSSDALADELLVTLGQQPDRRVGLGELPRRAWVHEHSDGDPILDGSRRAGAISTATVVLFRPRPGAPFHTLLVPRSRDVATHRFQAHVAPSGIFAPDDEEPAPSARASILREYAEELFDRTEHQEQAAGHLNVTELSEVRRLQDALDAGRAELLYTGVSVNLLSLRPEICTLLLVHDPDWWADERRPAEAAGQPMKLAWEYAVGDTMGALPDGRNFIGMLPFDDAREPLPRGDQLDPEWLVPNAAAALALALPVARSRLAGRAGGA